jgi:hypothetical protein
MSNGKGETLTKGQSESNKEFAQIPDSLRLICKDIQQSLAKNHHELKRVKSMLVEENAEFILYLQRS